MKLVIQKVSSASVSINSSSHNSISKGILVYLGFSKGDSLESVSWSVNKLLSLRLFEGDNKRFEKTIQDINGEFLIISQFTLYGDCSQGTRPKFNDSLEYSKANELYDKFLEELENKSNCIVKSGVFGAHMEISSKVPGPVTLIIEKEI